MSYLPLAKTLAESFNALADEVQSLVDRKTILEHKLRYAHEQYQHLADKYAPAVPEVSETLAKLQLPPDLHSSILETSTFVPLPRRGQLDPQHQIALFIREGRKVARQLGNLADMSKEGGSGSSKEAVAVSPFSETETATSLSTVLEQDFTVQGRKGHLECPFSKKESPAQEPDGAATADTGANPQENDDPTPHRSGDPICAAMYQESTTSAPARRRSSAAQCPIRFLDQHSPEEVANYVEKHKHEIPRSHEVCVRRYQRSQDQIRKLDAKYGNLSNMIQSLSQLHQPMLPAEAESSGGGKQAEVDRASNERVENWANAVSASDAAAAAAGTNTDGTDEARSEPEQPSAGSVSGSVAAGAATGRESHFDRPLKEVRVGESPSRPWGISVPFRDPVLPLGDHHHNHHHPRRASSPAAPVRIPSPSSQPATPQRQPQPQLQPQSQPRTTAAPPRRCPFDHTKLAFASPFPKPGEPPSPTSGAGDPDPRAERPFTPVKNRAPPTTMPTFVNPPVPPPEPKGDDGKPSANPQMVFNITGPVFIGYPMDQAMQFMQGFGR